MEPRTVAPQELRRDVSATVDEFVRGLRAAFPQSLEGSGMSFRVCDHPVTLEIELRIGPMRRIALLSLATLEVTLHFSGGDGISRTKMLEHLDRYLHRGGG